MKVKTEAEFRYRRQLAQNLWAFAQSAGLMVAPYRLYAPKTCACHDVETALVFGDLLMLLDALPMPAETGLRDKIAAALGNARSDTVRAFRVEEVEGLMRAADGDAEAQQWFGAEAITTKGYVEANVPQHPPRRRAWSYAGKAAGAVGEFLREAWPEDATNETIAEKIGEDAAFVKRNMNPRSLKLIDFLILMTAFDRHPILALRDLTRRIDQVVGKAG